MSCFESHYDIQIDATKILYVLSDLQLPNIQYLQNEIWLECKMNLINQLYSNPEPFDIHNAKVTCLQTSIQVCIEKVFLPKFLLC